MWIKEGFAHYFEYLGSDFLFPKWNMVSNVNLFILRHEHLILTYLHTYTHTYSQVSQSEGLASNRTGQDRTETHSCVEELPMRMMKVLGCGLYQYELRFSSFPLYPALIKRKKQTQLAGAEHVLPVCLFFTFCCSCTVFYETVGSQDVGCLILCLWKRKS